MAEQAAQNNVPVDNQQGENAQHEQVQNIEDVENQNLTRWYSFNWKTGNWSEIGNNSQCFFNLIQNNSQNNVED